MPHPKNAFRFLVYTPPGLADPSIACAACRAGEIGILDCLWTRDTGALNAAVETFLRLGRGECGLRLDAHDPHRIQALESTLPHPFSHIVLPFTDDNALRETTASFQERGCRVLCECISLREARAAADTTVDGCIAVGNESGGRIGEKSAFILMQQLLSRCTIPVYVRGGIGLHTAAACHGAGAAGVVLDAQLLCMRESLLPDHISDEVRRMDGSETDCYSGDDETCYRLLRIGRDAHRGKQLAALFHRTVPCNEPDKSTSSDVAIQHSLQEFVDCTEQNPILPIGQDGCFAAGLAARYTTVGRLLSAFRHEIESAITVTQRMKPLEGPTPLTRELGSVHPVVQGPMTRVSDNAQFAFDIAQAGGLPVCALGMMRGDEINKVLKSLSARLGDRPWGVGMLGFLDRSLFAEQMAVVTSFHPRLAVLAGGKPAQVAACNDAGIQAFLHIPSPALLDMYCREGVRHFIFEGRECGGHVGPRSSFVLWNGMVDALITHLPRDEIARCRVLFAGGIHDALSAACAAITGAPLVERGASLGLCVGTPYLFCREIVASGALDKKYQDIALQCDATTLLECGPGYVIRSARTPFAQWFHQEKQRLQTTNNSIETIRNTLENLTIGRLRLAAKKQTRRDGDVSPETISRFRPVSESEQFEQGMFMIGQAAALHTELMSIKHLHRSLTSDATRFVSKKRPSPVRQTRRPRPRPADIAVVGMACLTAGANDPDSFWRVLFEGEDAITEIPPHRWDVRRYYDKDRRATDRVYSRWGGFLEPVVFDPAEFGMPPNSLRSIEPVQLLTLLTVKQALRDAGCDNGVPGKSRTSVILGATGGSGELGQDYIVRSHLPRFVGDRELQAAASRLPEWTEDSFAGILHNVIAGRVSNRFDLGGVNFSIDAACGSSLAALYCAVRELRGHSSDLVVTGGADTFQSPFSYLCFSKTQALSPTG